MKRTNYQVRLYYNTIDLDGSRIERHLKQGCSKEYLERVTLKILSYASKNLCLAWMDVEETKKGYHIVLWCKKPCDLCRFVFDDFERYRRDINRPRYMQNVIFNSLKFKKIRLGGKQNDNS